MSTYIPGITDYIPQIQPFQPNYNFLGNILQTRQSRYDAAHKKLNGIYGTILNSPMLREENINRRDEFFKSIDGEIKRISGLDLSLQQNVDQAAAVFKPFYEDKDIQNDMIQTKTFYDGLQRHEALKNCNDPEKCGGQAWDPGAKQLQYKAEEFKKMSTKDALNFRMPTYTAYYNWEKDAMKLAKDMDYNVEKDTISGNWIVTQRNGELVQGGLLNLFSSAYGNDPRVSANNNTKAYVDRKDYTFQNAAKHGSEEAAEMFYLNTKIEQYNKMMQPLDKQVKDASAETAERKKQLTEDQGTVGLTPEDQKILDGIGVLQQSLDQTQKYVDVANNTVNSDQSPNVESLRQKGDAAAAHMLLVDDLYSMAETMSHRGEKLSYKENPYAMEAVKQKNREKMAAVDFDYYKLKKVVDVEAHKQEATFDHGLKTGAIPSSTSSVATLQDATPWATTTPGESAAIGIDENRETIQKMSQDRNSMNTASLWNVVQTAQLAASNGDVGATNYLNKLLGSDYKKVQGAEDMVKTLGQRKIALESAFDQTIRHIDPKQNPNGSVKWASTVLENNREMFNQTVTKNKAVYATIQDNMKVSSDIVNNIQKQAGPGQAAYADADLLLVGGMPMTDEEMPHQFVVNYMVKHKVSADEAYDQAKEIYEPLRDKFIETFGTHPKAMLNQGTGLKGGGTQTAYAMRYDNVNPGAYMDKGTKLLRGIMSAVVPNENAFNAIYGLPTKENIEKNENNESLKMFSREVMNDILSGNKDLGTLSYIESPIAGNNKDISALSVFLPTEYLAKHIGSKEKQGPLWNDRDKLLNGFTLYYNNKTIKTPTTEGTKTSDLVNVAKYQGLTYNYPDAAQDVKIVTDASGKLNAQLVLKHYEWDPTKKDYVESIVYDVQPITESGLVAADAQLNASLKQLQDQNVKIKKWQAANNKKRT